MPKFRKKPVVIEAFKLGTDEIPDWAHNSDDFVLLPNGSASTRTLEGTLHAEIGDVVIQGVKGEIYPCRADIFEATYEPAD